VKQRQVEVTRPLSDPHTTTPLNEMHRPRFLLSGLLTCGVCGGGFNRDQLARTRPLSRAPACRGGNGDPVVSFCLHHC
jgi:hypothetical protein